MPARRTALILLAASLALAGCSTTPPPSDEEVPSSGEADANASITAVARGLDTPWEIAFDGDRLFVTERRGRISTVGDGGQATPWKRLQDTVETGESGLMGLALHPGFPDEPWVYVCQTHRDDEGELVNRIARVRQEQGTGGRVQTLLGGIDASSIHDGCRLGFSPEGLLYATMGDAARASRAQNPSSPNGKVLRMTPEGDPAGADRSNWHPHVYTMGHRNPQGLDFHPDSGTPYISEHGPEDHDEVNVLEAGDNYGWPVTRGKDDGGGRYHPAIWSSGPDGTVAPAGAAFIQAEDSPLDGAFVFATLKAAQLHVLELDGPEDRQVVDEHVLLDGRFGRLRAVEWGPDEALYVSTSNQDGRGSPGPNDDRILRVPLGVLEDAVE